MGIHYNAQSVTGGLVSYVDAGNYKTVKGRRSIINWDSWTVGSGGATGYGQNGLTAENARLVDTDPWGNSNIVWGSYPSGDGNADGGWNTSWFTIDKTKLYRFSVWVRRISTTTGGTFYLGMYDNVGSVVMSTGAVNTNAYWDCRNISWMTQNQWYLVVGHVYPHDTTYTGRHPDSGVYTVEGGRFGNIGGCNIGSGDIKWNPLATSSLHRTYHYYCNDSTSRLQFYQPRVDLCDGTEPTINELLSNVASRGLDIVRQDAHYQFYNGPKVNTGGYFEFDGSSTYLNSAYTSTDLDSDPLFTVDMWIKRTATFNSGGYWGLAGDVSLQGINGYTHPTTANKISIDLWGTATFHTGVDYPLNQWVHVVWRKQSSNFNVNSVAIFINGVKYTGAAFTVVRGSDHTPNLNTSSKGITLGRLSPSTNSYYAPGHVANAKFYSVSLSDVEILQNFSAQRGRFGV